MPQACIGDYEQRINDEFVTIFARVHLHTPKIYINFMVCNHRCDELQQLRKKNCFKLTRKTIVNYLFKLKIMKNYLLQGIALSYC